MTYGDSLSKTWMVPALGLPLPQGSARLSRTDVVRIGASITGGDVILPAITASDSAITHNIAVMSGYCQTAGVHHAPHVKTHMSADIMRKQLSAGAWGLTAANVGQAAVALRAGAARVLVANQVLGRPDLRAMLNWTRAGHDVVCLVDSVDTVAVMEDRIPAPDVRLKVLVELGYSPGRTGARTVKSAIATAEAAAASRHLQVLGVESYEGVVAHDSSAQSLSRVDDHLRILLELSQQLFERGLIERDRPLLSAGGTRFLDRVVHVTEPGNTGSPDVLVRCGSYVAYGVPTPAAGAAATLTHHGEGLRPALSIWSEIISRPEPDLAILALGRHHIGDRIRGLHPDVLLDPAGERHPASGITLTTVDDQHAYATVKPYTAPVGTLVKFNLDYPWSLDHWRIISVLDTDERMVDLWETSP